MLATGTTGVVAYQAVPAAFTRPTRNSPVLFAGLIVQVTLCVEPLGHLLVAVGLVMIGTPHVVLLHVEAPAHVVLPTHVLLP